MLKIFFLIFLVVEVFDSPVIAATNDPSTKWDNLSSTELPTTITSDSMTLKSKEQTFVYSGNVVLKKGDFTMTSKKLEGRYNDDQGIEELRAFDDVHITKGETIKARSNKAVYDKSSETMILTDNPEITEDQSILTADIVTIYLTENRSLAEGNVRVKLIQTDGTR